MNASALLKSQGWRGKGHTLHATDNSIGLANPLLLSRNTDGKGLGANKTFTDQWWLAAFDEKLKGLDVTKKGVVQTVTAGALSAVQQQGGVGGKYSGLYASFVKGGLMEGTLEGMERGESTDGTPVSEDRESVPGLREGLKVKQSREERRTRKEERVKMKEAKALRRKLREERAAAKAEKKRSKEAEATRLPKEQETKEQRKARRIERRARKEARRKRREEKDARKAAKG